MDNLTKISLVVILSMAIYCLFTIPMLIAFITMDVNTVEYIGIIYPKWITYTISFISGYLGYKFGKIIIEKHEK